MRVKRIVADIGCSSPKDARRCYGDVLGLELLMDLDWIRTYGSSTRVPLQISFCSQGGIEYGPVEQPWGVRRFFVRDPFGRLVNILAHVGR